MALSVRDQQMLDNATAGRTGSFRDMETVALRARAEVTDKDNSFTDMYYEFVRFYDPGFEDSISDKFITLALSLSILQ